MLLLFGRTRSTIWDSKEPCSLHCIHEGLQSKFTYFIRIIESFEDYVDPIQEAIDDLLLPTLSGEREPFPSDLRQLVTLPRSRRARRTRLTVWSPTAVCCFYVNKSTARRFYYHIQHVHGGRREFHGRVKKTTSSLENCVGEIENGKYWFHSTLGSAAVS